MWGRIIDYTGGISYTPPASTRREIMTPNAHYINMLINIGIFGMLIYVAIQVS